LLLVRIDSLFTFNFSSCPSRIIKILKIFKFLLSLCAYNIAFTFDNHVHAIHICTTFNDNSLPWIADDFSNSIIELGLHWKSVTWVPIKIDKEIILVLILTGIVNGAYRFLDCFDRNRQYLNDFTLRYSKRRPKIFIGNDFVISIRMIDSNFLIIWLGIILIYRKITFKSLTLMFILIFFRFIFFYILLAFLIIFFSVFFHLFLSFF